MIKFSLDQRWGSSSGEGHRRDNRGVQMEAMTLRYWARWKGTDVCGFHVSDLVAYQHGQQLELLQRSPQCYLCLLRMSLSQWATINRHKFTVIAANRCCSYLQNSSENHQVLQFQSDSCLYILEFTAVRSSVVLMTQANKRETKTKRGSQLMKWLTEY